MDYVIDVIACRNRAAFVDHWTRQRDRLATQNNDLVNAELFEMQKNIRDAHYDFVAVYSWQNAIKAQAMLTAPPVEVGVNRCRAHYRLEVQLGSDISADATHGWLVNPFEINPEQVSSVLDMWDKAKDYMAAKPGFINARLFRAMSAGADYNLINVAEWVSDAAFMAALDSKAYDEHREKSLQYKLHPSLSIPLHQPLNRKETPMTEGAEL